MTILHMLTLVFYVLFNHGSGVDLLDNGRNYVALTDSTCEQLAIIVETMQRNSLHSVVLSHQLITILILMSLNSLSFTVI